MPLTEKGEEIKSAMAKEYGGKKGEQVFYASKNAGTISGVDALSRRLDALCGAMDSIESRFDAMTGPDVVVGVKASDFALDEVKHDPSNGQFTGGSGGTSAEKKKISVSDLKTKLEGASHAKLMSALNNKDVDPEIKKHIEKELDSRANRGTSKGFGEAHDSQNGGLWGREGGIPVRIKAAQ